MSKRHFLSAKWEYLVMFNYEVDPAVLVKHIPPGTEIDYFNGKAFVSIVGFLFKDTKVFGVKWPYHINFEEANLRYYLKKSEQGIWKRGVGFVSEIVPKPLVASIANLLYNEHYSVAKMSHKITHTPGNLLVEYKWNRKKQFENVLQVNASTIAEDIESGSEAAFILEHYFGYNQLNKSTTIEYAVKHPKWKVFPVKDYYIKCDIENLYGKEFVPFILNMKPSSVFIAEGSRVTVDKPVKIKL